MTRHRRIGGRTGHSTPSPWNRRRRRTGAPPRTRCRCGSEAATSAQDWAPPQVRLHLCLIRYPAVHLPSSPTAGSASLAVPHPRAGSMNFSTILVCEEDSFLMIVTVVADPELGAEQDIRNASEQKQSQVQCRLCSSSEFHFSLQKETRKFQHIILKIRYIQVQQI
jgi:hypothetical protein